MTSLHQYVRDRKNNPIGVVVAIKIGDKVHLGWSLAKYKAGDKFNKETGMSIAMARAVLWPTRKSKIPHPVKKHFADIKTRAAKYFKDAQLADGVTS